LIQPALSAIDTEAAQLPAQVDNACWQLMIARVGEYRGTLESRLDAALQRIAKACGHDLTEVICLQQAITTCVGRMVRRVRMPKGTGQETRPLGIPTLEDKVLQRAVVRLPVPSYDDTVPGFVKRAQIL
jgi:hypothetical protein